MAASLSIDPLDGTVHLLGIPFAIRKGVARAAASQALQSLFRSSAKTGNGYEWLSFHKASFGGQPCGFALGFHDGRLFELQFSVMLPNAEMKDGWPTRAAIEAELAFVRGELSRQLATVVGERSVRFSWGSVWSAFDPKGFQASSGLRHDA